MFMPFISMSWRNLDMFTSLFERKCYVFQHPCSTSIFVQDLVVAVCSNSARCPHRNNDVALGQNQHTLIDLPGRSSYMVDDQGSRF